VGNLITVTLSDPTHLATAVLDIKILGIRNPRTFKPTDNVNINTFDSGGKLIDSGAGFSTQMTVMNTFPNFVATIVNRTNGALTDYTLTFTTSQVSLMTGDILYVTFPTNVILPTNALCSIVSAMSIVTCQNSGQNLVARFNGVTTTTSYSFRVRNVLNPSSTKASNPFTNIYITDSSGNNVMQLVSNVIPTVLTSLPANILTYSLY
jgi:hypothetical protein